MLLNNVTHREADRDGKGAAATANLPFRVK